MNALSYEDSITYEERVTRKLLILGLRNLHSNRLVACHRILAKEFAITDPEVARIKSAIQTWDSYGANADRRWLKPLVEMLFPAGPQ